MKKTLLLIIIISSISLTAVSQIPSGLVSHWSFDGNSAADNYGTNNGTVSGAVSTSGLLNEAFSFDGINDYITIPKAFATTLDNDFSVSAWFYYEGLNSDDRDYQSIIDFRGEKQIFIFIEETTRLAYLWIYDGSTSYSLYTNQTFSLNKWHHIVVVRESDEFKIYLDGVSGDTMIMPVLASTNHNNRIGKLYNDVNGGTGHRGAFNGKLDEVMVFNRALNILEILDLYSEISGEEIALELWKPNIENIYYNGNVSIAGTSVPSGFNFSVDGKIVAKEIKVTVDNWPDFVFRNEYDLLTLQELEDFIIKNGHLPEIPTSHDVEHNGIYLGEINAKLLQKIEELTLYLIEQNKENQELRRLIEELQKEISAFKE